VKKAAIFTSLQGGDRRLDIREDWSWPNQETHVHAYKGVEV